MALREATRKTPVARVGTCGRCPRRVRHAEPIHRAQLPEGRQTEFGLKVPRRNRTSSSRPCLQRWRRDGIRHPGTRRPASRESSRRRSRGSGWRTPLPGSSPVMMRSPGLQPSRTTAGPSRGPRPRTSDRRGRRRRPPSHGTWRALLPDGVVLVRGALALPPHGRRAEGNREAHQSMSATRHPAFFIRRSSS